MHIGDNFSEDKFKDINEAYKVLSDTKSRKRYDRNWHTYTQRKKKIESNQKEEKKTLKDRLLEMFFGITTTKTKQKNNKKLPLNGENIDTDVEVSILEAFFGTSKKLKLLTIDGKTRTFNLNIPAGIQNRDKIRFVGQGKLGKNGGKNGDLLVKVVIKDTKDFKLNGTDIYKEIEIKPWQAALGTKLKIESIDGEVTLLIPKGTQSGDKFTIKGKGYKYGRAERGNFQLITKIIVPKKMSKQEEEIYEKLKQIENV